MMMICEGRDCRSDKVIYFGLPGRLCANENCNLLTGPAAHVPAWLSQFAVSEDGFAFMAYEGSYWRALGAWLRGE